MKNYIVSIGEVSFEVHAKNLKDAKAIANFHKRMERYKGKTTVKAKKQ